MESSSDPPATFFTREGTRVGAALLIGTLISLLVTVVQGPPAPRIQDEFGYLLTADTFAKGNVSNPTHPFWHHFESFHIIHEPTYNSKYPPLQSLTLAVGQQLGHPIIGACLGTGISVAALVWMLFGWLPKQAHGLAWWVVVTQPWFHLHWSQSFMGGAVALTGAALLLGAFARLDSKLNPFHGGIAALGIILLANSRPFEGLVLTVAVAGGVLHRLLRSTDWQKVAFIQRVVGPAVLLLACGGLGMMFYNYNVTQDPWTMPYQVHEETYGWNPVFLWQTAGDKPDYRHPEMDRFFTTDKETTEQSYSSLGKTLKNKLTVVGGLLVFFCGPLLITGLVGSVWNRHSLAGYAFAFLVPVLLASIISKWAGLHYAAPAAPLLFVVMLGGTTALWARWRPDHARVFRLLTWTLLAFHCLWMIHAVAQNRSWHAGNWGTQREEVIERLEESKGRDLVFVRYTDDHIVHEEWVYNSSDIDAQSVIWAREISPRRRQALINYYGKRRVWILVAGKGDYRLVPIEDADQLGNLETLPEPSRLKTKDF